jgi:hypothetical protein
MGAVETKETEMRIILLGVLVALSLLTTFACSVTPTNLHPVAGTREGVEQFKDDSTN